jgi:4'-phosphopantetheinyl transferase
MPTNWEQPPAAPVATEAEVHVWQAALAVPPSLRASLQGLLSPDELQRAGRFHFVRDRDHFILARGLLRLILSLYTGTPAARLGFIYNSHGKPALEGGQVPSFNLSHSGDLVLYAITAGRVVGIDVEQMRIDFATAEIADRFFALPERLTLRRLPAELHMQAFYNCWTRKEAYIKARGEGLSIPLDQFEVSLIPGVPAALLHSEAGQEEAARWRLEELDPDPAYAAAVAVEGHDWQLRCWQLAEESLHTLALPL